MRSIGSRLNDLERREPRSVMFYLDRGDGKPSGAPADAIRFTLHIGDKPIVPTRLTDRTPNGRGGREHL